MQGVSCSTVARRSTRPGLLLVTEVPKISGLSKACSGVDIRVSFFRLVSLYSQLSYKSPYFLFVSYVYDEGRVVFFFVDLGLLVSRPSWGSAVTLVCEKYGPSGGLGYRDDRPLVDRPRPCGGLCLFINDDSAK